MRQIAVDFTAGDFSRPFAVHAVVVPGTKTMAEWAALLDGPETCVTPVLRLDEVDAHPVFAGR